MKLEFIKTFVVGNPPPSFGGQYFIFVKLLKKPLQWEGGDVIPSKEPGLGAEVS